MEHQNVNHFGGIQSINQSIKLYFNIIHLTSKKHRDKNKTRNDIEDMIKRPMRPESDQALNKHGFNFKNNITQSQEKPKTNNNIQDMPGKFNCNSKVNLISIDF